MRNAMSPVAWLDDIAQPAWIAAMIVSFVLFWPFGLVVLGFLIGSGRMGCWSSRRGGSGGDWRAHTERMQERAARWFGPRGGGGQRSGNRAFDEYREDTLRRLEEEEREFKEFLDRLRRAKDKAEFDQFMAEMRRRPEGPIQGPMQGPAPQP